MTAAGSLDFRRRSLVSVAFSHTSAVLVVHSAVIEADYRKSGAGDAE